MKKMGTIAFLLLAVSGAFADSLLDAVISNDLPMVRKKVAVLELELSDRPFCAQYLASAKVFNADMWKYLIDHGADINMPDQYGVAPIHWAVVRREPTALAAVLSAGANLMSSVSYEGLNENSRIVPRYLHIPGTSDTFEIKDNEYLHALTVAVLTRNLPAVQVLAPLVSLPDSGLHVSEVSIIDLPFYLPEEERTMSPAAAQILQVLIRKAAKLPEDQRMEVSSELQNWLYYFAIDDIASVRKILAADSEETAPMLPYAIILGATKCLGLLVELDDLTYSSAVSFSIQLPFGSLSGSAKSPLYAFALLCGNLEMLRFFADKKTDFNRPIAYSYARGDDSFSKTEPALLFALRQVPDSPIPDFLIASKVDVNAKSDDGSSPIHLAVRTAGLRTISGLLSAKAAVDAKDAEGRVPAAYAVIYGRLDVLKALVSAGAKLDPVDRHGYGLVHLAAVNGHLDIVKYLVEKKAPYGVKSTDRIRWYMSEDEYCDLQSGMTALDMIKLIRDSSERDSVKAQYKSLIDYLARLPAVPAKK